jgi:hypothetical protein
MTKISRATLRAVVKQRAKVEQEQAKLKAVEEKLTVELKQGATVKPGVLIAYIREWERRSVAWKEIVIREKGQEFADRVFNATKPDPQSKLVVETAG